MLMYKIKDLNKNILFDYRNKATGFISDYGNKIFATHNYYFFFDVKYYSVFTVKIFI